MACTKLLILHLDINSRAGVHQPCSAIILGGHAGVNSTEQVPHCFIVPVRWAIADELWCKKGGASFSAHFSPPKNLLAQAEGQVHVADSRSSPVVMGVGEIWLG